MKIFDQPQVSAENISKTMENNLLKNVFAEEQEEPRHRTEALQRLSEAAELFEKSGNANKAQKITNLLHKLVITGAERENGIKRKIAELENSLNKLKSFKKNDSLNNYYKQSCENKIRSLISTIGQTYSDLNDSISHLKSAYTNNPKTLSAIDESVKVAQATISLMDGNFSDDDFEEESEEDDLSGIFDDLFEGSDEQEKIIESGDPEAAYRFALDNPNADIKRLQDVVVKARNPRWIARFSNDIEGADTEFLQDLAFDIFDEHPEILGKNKKLRDTSNADDDKSWED